ncbi:MAG: bifunctional sulfate adenylyltransferase/adenylylsulfate kinase [Candidatus Sedimenticola sp. (ex Thyasira tokunagai)]
MTPNNSNEKREYHLAPHGGELCDLLVTPDLAELLKTESETYPSVTLTRRQLCDLELLMNGGFSPLKGFMGKDAYESVLSDMRLPDGNLWPIPIVLDIAESVTEQVAVGEKLALRDPEGFMVAVLSITDLWKPDKSVEAAAVYGTESEDHPGVHYLMHEVHPYYVGGGIQGIQLPSHYDFENLWDTPAELRHSFEKSGWRRVIAFQTSKPMHRIHREFTLDAAKREGAHLLLHPTVGTTKPGDLQYYARVHCYQAIKKYFPRHLTKLSLLPLAMRMAGPRETLWHGLIHQNYGCSHFIVGPDHAVPPNGNGGDDFYATYASQELTKKYQDELQIKMVPLEEWRYVPSGDHFLPASAIDESEVESLRFSEPALRENLLHDEPIAEWQSYPEVIDALRKVYPPRKRLGFTLFFTGLSGSGKSTLAKIVYAKLIEEGGRPVTLLDGDVVRMNLSSELGFSKVHRDLNIRRIGFVANEITKNRGVAICAPIAPYTATRRAVRSMIEQHGDFIEIHVATPLEVCEARDRKGLYAKARKGVIPVFTGISDPYETPEKPEFYIDTSQYSPMEAAQEIFLYLLGKGYLDSDN